MNSLQWKIRKLNKEKTRDEIQKNTNVLAFQVINSKTQIDCT